MIEEIDNSGNVQARYSHGNSIDEPLAMLRSGTATYYEKDGLGAVTSLSGSTGSLTGTYDYDSLGNLIATTGALANPFRYTSRELDSETSLYFYRARYYDQGSGRFLSEDPLAFQGGINFYEYANNRPNDVTDPFGLSPRDVDQIVSRAQQIIAEMTASRARSPNGNWGNFVASMNMLSGGHIGTRYHGCGEQADQEITELTPLIQTLDDIWTFDKAEGFFFPFYHQWVIARSNNPKDPIVVIDPWEGVVMATVPQNNEMHVVK